MQTNILYIPIIFLVVACQPIIIPTNTTNTTATNITNIVQINVSMVSPEGNLAFYFINVSQGDAALVVSPEGETLLIDGGKQNQGKVIIDYLTGLGITKLDVVIATHPDADHIGGLPAVILKMKPDIIFDNGIAKDTDTYREYKSMAEDKEQTVARDMAFNLGNVTVWLMVEYDDGSGYSDNINDDSIVAKVVYKNVSALFAGDCETSCEQRISSSNLDADILKVAHHGGCTAISLNFIKETTPDYSVISVGENSYGHPCQEVVDRLNTYSAKVYRTDVDGTVILITDGKYVYS